MGCCGGLFRVILITLNLVLFLGGCLMIGAGSYLHHQIKNNEEFLDNRGSQAGIAAIALGGIIALVSFLGCCGLCKKSTGMIKLYGICVTVLLVAQIGCGIFAYVKRGDADSILERGMKSALDNYDPTDDTRKPLVEAWDALQHDLQCCGVNSYTDWKNSSSWKTGHENDVPDSCCKKESKGCGVGKASGQDIYTEGCKGQMIEQFTTHIDVVAGVGVGAGFLQLIIVIAAFCLGKRYEEELFAV